MAATNPRITITLRPELHAILRRLSVLTGNSQSAIVGELLEASSDVFERMAQTLDYAEKLRAQGLAMPEAMKGSLERAQHRIESQLGLALDDFKEGAGSLLEEAEKIQRRSGRPTGEALDGGMAAAAPSTPISNRGVTPHPKAAKRSAHTRKPGVNPTAGQIVKAARTVGTKGGRRG